MERKESAIADSFSASLDSHEGLDERSELSALKELMKAYKVTKDGDHVPDNTVRLEALKLLMKLKGRLGEKDDAKKPTFRADRIYVLQYPEEMKE